MPWLCIKEKPQSAQLCVTLCKDLTSTLNYRLVLFNNFLRLDLERSSLLPSDRLILFILVKEKP